MELDWDESGHISYASKGRFRDPCVYSATSGDDTYGDPGPWRPYRQEVVVAQVVDPFGVRRLAHHRSRIPGDSYQYHRRVSRSWCGSTVGWVSNFGSQGSDYADAYVIQRP